MANVAVIGAQWGDEGKGKVVDWLASRADIVVRFQGGHNAGHTLVVGNQTYKLSLLPCGLVRGKLGIIGNGVVVDPEALLAEIERVQRAGAARSRLETLRIADNAPLILPLHRRSTGRARRRAASGKIGTTGRGIGPAYEDKVARRAIRVADLAEPETLSDKLDELLLHHNTLLRGLGAETFAKDALLDQLLALAPRILPFAEPVWERLDERAARRRAHPVRGRAGGDAGRRSRHLSVRHQQQHGGGNGGVRRGDGAGARSASCSGIAKAYTHARRRRARFRPSCTDATGQLLGDRGHEFGTVTGRRRRCGWFDAALVRQAVKVGGIQGLALTKLDVLDGLAELKICAGYRIGGDDAPAPAGRARAPRRRRSRSTRRMEGWPDRTRGARSLGRSAGAGDEIRPADRGTGGGAGHAALHQPGARRHDPGARPVRRLNSAADWALPSVHNRPPRLGA